MKTALRLFGILAPLTLVMASGSAPAMAGGVSEGGGDYHTSWFGSAWYLGSGAIRTCVDMAPDFGIPLEQAKADILSAFSVWKRYLDAKKVYLQDGPEFRIVADIQLLPACDGTQELTIHLGSSNAEVEKAKAQFENPMAFIQRDSYDLDTARSKGFMWIAKSGSVLPKAGKNGSPDWTMAWNFHGIVLHEAGHLMGVPHVRGTIMDEDWLLSRFQASDMDEFRRVSFTKVDYLHEIKMLPTQEVEYEGFFGPWPCGGRLGDCVPEYSAAFQTLVGRAPVGKVVRAHFYGAGRGTSSDGSMYLEVTDDVSTSGFRLEPNAHHDLPLTFDLAKDVFKVYRNVHEGMWTSKGFSYTQAGSVKYMTLVTGKGERLLASIERNSSEPTALQIRLFLPDGDLPVFVADKFKMPY